ncbi:PIG-L family deacetylase [Roseisolibacter sp. H3M3-2]|uniref:PIG-L family deacetylase n=1 Tax=Roseisolibacter sp. H3M3-2 TaxID=3031323 RepID=UPI0023DC1FE7|nr:PIG-L family deacetylase [Roseisolibacter sp. H3M3-2]MDF1505015.1 PIG-L family deacetylase [Roseisolibacter sp. H3M3-2]
MTTAALMVLPAHPDDERFTLASTAARLADAGTTVGLMCATRGQVGSAGDPSLATGHSLPAVRERELRDPCAIRGVALLASLDHQDGHLGDADSHAVRERLATRDRMRRTSVLVPRDPESSPAALIHETLVSDRSAAAKSDHPSRQPRRLRGHSLDDEAAVRPVPSSAA